MAAEGSEWQRTVGQRVRALRRHLRWNQRQLATLWDMHRSGVSRIERGLQAITLEQADRLTRQAGMSLDPLVGRASNAPELFDLYSIAVDLPPEWIGLLTAFAQTLRAFWQRIRQRRPR